MMEAIGSSSELSNCQEQLMTRKLQSPRPCGQPSISTCVLSETWADDRSLELKKAGVHEIDFGEYGNLYGHFKRSSAPA